MRCKRSILDQFEVKIEMLLLLFLNEATKLNHGKSLESPVDIHCVVNGEFGENG